MTIAARFARYEARPAKYVGAAYARRLDEYQNANAMSALSGAPIGELDERMTELLASGRVSNSEYLELTLALAHEGYVASKPGQG